MGRRNDRDSAINRLAAAQHGVITLAQLEDLGLRSSSVRSRVIVERLFRLHAGVYAVGRPDVGPLGLDLAAVLAYGPEAVLSHRSAAALWGIRSRWWLIEVTVPTHRRDRPGVLAHESATLTAADITVREGIRVTTPHRTLLDLADVLTPSRLQRDLATAERLGLVDRADLLTVPAGRRRVVRDGHRFLRSGLEERFLVCLGAWGIELPETNQLVAGWEVDALWRRQRLVVELDTYATHRDREAFERDRLKQERLEEAGYTVRRVTDTRLDARPGEVRAMLSRLVGGESRDARA
jgi:hypothetical protein